MELDPCLNGEATSLISHWAQGFSSVSAVRLCSRVSTKLSNGGKSDWGP